MDIAKLVLVKLNHELYEIEGESNCLLVKQKLLEFHQVQV